MRRDSEAPNGVARLHELSADRQALLRARLARRARQRESGIERQPRPAGTEFPLSYEQEELWFLHRFAPESTMYNAPIVWQLRGSLEPAAVAAAIDRVVARHEVLRTRFVERDGCPVQVIDPPVRSRLRVRLSRGSVLPDRLRLECDRPFDLTRGPQLRPVLFRVSPTEHTLVLDVHHIVSDEWSEAVLWRDFAAYYREALGVSSELLPELPVQYGDFAVWQRKQLFGSSVDGLAAFWRRTLDRATTLVLPTDRPRPRTQTFNGSAVWFPIPPRSAALVADIGRQMGATPFMCYLAAFAVLLARWSGQHEVTVGTITSGRRHPQLRELVGFFINTVVLRTDLSGRPSFRELVDRVRRLILDAYAHEAPFRKVVEVVRPRREPGRSPLFQVMFSYTAAGAERQRHLPGATATPSGVDMPVARFDLVLNVREAADGLTGVIEYNTDLFTTATVETVAARFVELLAETAADPGRPLLGDIGRQPSAENSRLLEL